MLVKIQTLLYQFLVICIIPEIVVVGNVYVNTFSPVTCLILCKWYLPTSDFKIVGLSLICEQFQNHLLSSEF